MVNFRKLKDTRAFLGKLWVLVKPFWVSEERWAAIGLLAVVVALNLAIVYLNVKFNNWYGVFYDALQKKSRPCTSSSSRSSRSWRFSTSSRRFTASICARCSRSGGAGG